MKHIISTSVEGRGAMTEIERRVFSVNAFMFNHNFMSEGERDFIEWDIATEDPTRAILTVRLTDRGDQYHFARAYPCMATSMAGRYESVGVQTGEVEPVLPGKPRLSSPAYDLHKVRELAGNGYPCWTKDIPDTRVYAACDIPADMNANKMVDSYFYYSDDAGDDLNLHVMPPHKKLLNVQLQMGCGRKNNPDKHANGWSGGQLVFDHEIEIDGKRGRMAHKMENALNNDFPFFSFDFECDDISFSAVISWILTNWAAIEKACRDRGLDLKGCTFDKLMKSVCCGPHIGNELLGRCVGSIHWDRIEKVTDQNVPGLVIGGLDESLPVVAVSECDHSEPEPQPEQAKEPEATQAEPEPELPADDLPQDDPPNDVTITEPLTLYLGKKKKAIALPESVGSECVIFHGGQNNNVYSCPNNWDSSNDRWALMLVPEEIGQTTIKWRAVNTGAEYQTQIIVKPKKK